LDRFSTGSLPPFHYYAKPVLGREISFGPYKTDPRAIRGQRLFERDSKAILGEFNSDVNRFGKPWARDLGNRDSTLSRLNLLRDAGCELALLRPDYGPDDDAVIGTAIRDKGRFVEERQICVDYDILKLLGSTREVISQFCGFRMPTEPEWARDKRCINTPGLDERIAKKRGNLSAWKAVVRSLSHLKKCERRNAYQRDSEEGRILLSSTLTLRFHLEFSSPSCSQMHLLMKF